MFLARKNSPEKSLRPGASPPVPIQESTKKVQPLKFREFSRQFRRTGPKIPVGRNAGRYGPLRPDEVKDPGQPSPGGKAPKSGHPGKMTSHFGAFFRSDTFGALQDEVLVDPLFLAFSEPVCHFQVRYLAKRQRSFRRKLHPFLFTFHSSLFSDVSLLIPP